MTCATLPSRRAAGVGRKEHHRISVLEHDRGSPHVDPRYHRGPGVISGSPVTFDYLLYLSPLSDAIDIPLRDAALHGIYAQFIVLAAAAGTCFQ
jgi:hypothetical protein